jgi:hypothetical protein
MLQLVSQLKREMGACTFFFSCFNPTGRYRLNLGVPYQRDVAKLLMVMNKKVYAAIKAKEITDRSQKGNLSCFRNERVNGYRFTLTPTWKLPSTGTFEFDFVQMAERPLEAQQSTPDEIQCLYEWFEATYEQLKASIPAKHQAACLAQIGEALSECFRGVAEYFVMSSD